MTQHVPKNILVTGGAGFIGANFVHYYFSRYPGRPVVVLDALTYAGNYANLQPISEHPGLTFVHGDIRDDDLVLSLLKEHKIDTIVHFAAESHVDRSIHGPDAFIDTNVVGTHALLKAAKVRWLDTGTGMAHRFHHVSTDEVYGTLGPEDPPFSEETPYRPNSPYAASKAGSDHLVRAYHETYGLQTTISNCSNNYGPYQFPEKLIPLVISRIMDSGEIPVYGDGRQIRDWLYVDDHNAGIDVILNSGIPGETYNIGGNNQTTNIDIIHHICDCLEDRYPGARSLITHVTDRPGHDRRYAINADKIRRELDFSPQHNFNAGIRKTIEWYLANESWWRKVMDGSYREWVRANYEQRR
ncbi:MAG: dTDP-glucose 4,6-dehydratase [Thermodesulfobacteriota bacterium]|nr:dTDP-glucose 4,6-dehydratase [Thermodesulfobacteriota bacterium]